MPLPILYTFRRCPYAMRARLGLLLGEAKVEIREIILKAKPSEMLAANPRGTVPVLVQSNGQVISESLEIMYWALRQGSYSQTIHPLLGQSQSEKTLIDELITLNDQQFKPWLDKYKYADRHPEFTQEDYFIRAAEFLARLETELNRHQFLVRDSLSLADYAIVPFIRQFTAVDSKRDLHLHFPRLIQWLTLLIQSTVFHRAMEKYPVWEQGQVAIYLE
ncbi:glutathione S-transferase [Shewanella acanthi]|uniref:glutathione S-transferase n=1 Tax=Shewanella acanthi TaxID=2864212 RepID=UPI001C659C4D|nr:glutathione S-transferase [Shewanella acanthi]QYJ80342.1 glutathione S-transferase [Shewanella acanthi]